MHTLHNRRQFSGLALGRMAGVVLTCGPTWAWALSAPDAARGLKAALERGADNAVGLLGRSDGFLGDPKVRIPLPQWLEKSSRVFKLAGQQDQLDTLVTSMNRAAEAAVPAAKPLLIDAIRGMSLSDAQQLVQGGDTAATEFFATRTRGPLATRFLPVIKEATAKVSLAQAYNTLVDKAKDLGVRNKAADQHVEDHVTHKALDGLFAMMGEEERRIRKDPVGTGSDLLRQVFGR